MVQAANLMKYNCQFQEGPRGPKLSWDYTSDMSKCDTGPAFPPSLRSFVILFSIQVPDMVTKWQQNFKQEFGGQWTFISMFCRMFSNFRATKLL